MKLCSRCREVKSPESFHKNYRMKSGLTTYCKDCSNAVSRELRAKDRQKTNVYASRWKSNNMEASLVIQARTTAKKKGYQFDLSKEALSVPDVCPVLGIPLFRTPGCRTHNTPSLDRIDNSKGYVRGNVRVISWRANQLKNNASIEEIRALLQYMEGQR